MTNEQSEYVQELQEQIVALAAELQRLGQPEAGATLFDAVTGEPAGQIESVSETGHWRLPVGLKAGRYRVMLPYEFDVDDYSAFYEAQAGAEIPRARVK